MYFSARMKTPRDFDIFAESTVTNPLAKSREGRRCPLLRSIAGQKRPVKIEDVLSDEVAQFGVVLGGGAPEVGEARRRERGGGGGVFGEAVAQVLETRHVSDGGVQPDIEVFFVVAVGNAKAEVGGVAGDVPVAQSVGEPFLEFVGGLFLQAGDGFAGGGGVGDFGADPFAQFVGEFSELEKAVKGLARLGGGAGDGGARVFEFGGGVDAAAFLAGVAVLVLGAALGAFAFDIAVGEEHSLAGGRRVGGRGARL